MYIIGITGGTGAGKSSAVKALKKLGAAALDCDAIYHEVLQNNIEMKDELEAQFSNISTDGEINRKKLSEIVWNDPDSLHELNRITHKYMDSEIDKRIDELKQQNTGIVAIDAIALIESGQNKKCDITIGIVSPKEKRLLRIIQRDKLSREHALKRINAQQPEEFYQENCNRLLENSYDTEAEFEAKCRGFFEALLSQQRSQNHKGAAMTERVELRNKIDSWFDSNSGDMINDLSRLIEINSVRGKSEEGAPYGAESRKVLSLAQSMLENRGFNVNLFEDMIITADYGPNPPLMGILAHLDIVAAGEGWNSDPFKLTLNDGKLYGRGVMDNKGPAIAAMYSLYCVRELCSALNHGVQIILGSGEETGFDDITQYLKKNTPPANVFTPDAEFPVVNIEKGRFMPVFEAKWEKDTTLPRIIEIKGGTTPNSVPNYSEAVIEGFSFEEVETFCKEYSEKTGVIISVKHEIADHDMTAGIQENLSPLLRTKNTHPLVLTAEGTSSHASLPERGNNAQTALISMLTAMPFANSTGFEYLCKLNRLFPHGDNNGTAFGIDMNDELTGRITVNFGVLRFSEYEFSGNFDSRTPSCADDINLFGNTKAILESNGINITYHEITGCHHTPEETEFVQKLLNVYEEYTGNPRKCLAIGGLTYVHDIPGGVAFGCAMPGDDNKVHGVNEYIEKDNLIKYAKMFTQVILDMCN